MAEFVPFAKIPRLRRGCTITEKIDGTNAQVFITGDANHTPDGAVATIVTTHPIAIHSVYAGSRNRWLQPGKGTDNFGFAQWVKDNAEVLVKTLGPGRHYGEWWGQGIQRGYGLDYKRFSLFNIKRWADVVTTKGFDDAREAGLDIVPLMYEGDFSEEAIENCLMELDQFGSYASPSFDGRPEGVVVRMESSGHLYKVLLDNDQLPKGAVA